MLVEIEAFYFLEDLVVPFSLSIVSDSLWPHGLQHPGFPITNSWSWLKLMTIQSMMPLNHLLLPSIFPSIRWPKYWSFSFSIGPSGEYVGLISFRTDWLDLLAVQGTLDRLFQHHSSKPSVLQSSAFFMVQLSRPYMSTGKTIALIW